MALRSFVHVRLIKATDLFQTDIVGEIDPFCKLKLGNKQKRKTKVHPGGGQNVSFENDEPIAFHYSQDEGSLLSIQVMDKDSLTRSDLVGEAMLDIRGIDNQVWEGEIQLYRSGGFAGKLLLEISHNIPITEEASRPRFNLIPLKARNNKMAAHLTSSYNAKNQPSFCTFELQLRGIAEIFGDAWNANYDKEHAVAFEDSIKGKTIRAVLAGEHALLYRDGTRSSFLRFSKKNRMKLKWISDKEGFCGALNYGIRDNVPRVFTYAIIDEGLYTSETGIAMAKDVMSKHAVHANASPKVRMAGTFRFCYDQEKKEHILVMDNDSGTYRPTFEHFPLVKQLFELNFPGLRVECLNVVESQPEETKVWAGPLEVCPALDVGPPVDPSANPAAARETRTYCTHDERTQVYPGKWEWTALPPTISFIGTEL